MNRSLIVIGRVGTVLVTIGLALLLVSLIPPIQLYSFGGSRPLNPETFEPLGSTPFGESLGNASISAQPFSTLSPQQELKVTLTCNDTITIYLLKMSLETLSTHLTNSSVTLLNDFLEANPDVIGWQGEIREGTVDYVPTEIINATLVFSNPSSTGIDVEYDGSILSLLAPASKVQTLALGAIPIGFLLALPWLWKLWKSRTASRSQGLTKTKPKQ
jgi:hypothetical protein